MRNTTIAMTLSSLIICGSACTDEAGPVCHKCEIIREYNAAHPENNYYWYDDYLKKNKEEPKPSSTPQATNNAPETKK